MDYIKTFSAFINENLSNSYIYKEDSGSGKPTMILKVSSKIYPKIKDLFDESGRPKSKEIKDIPFDGYKWDLYSQKYTFDGDIIYKIYGVSGDYTFGNAPTFYQQKLRGNKKAAKFIFNWFIKKYLK